MIIILSLIGWYLLGVCSSLFFIYYKYGEIKGDDLYTSLFFGIFGIVEFIYVICLIIEYKMLNGTFKDKVLFKKKGKDNEI